MSDKTIAVAKKFAEDLFGKDDEVAETALQIACVFIEKRGLADEFAAFAEKEASDHEDHRCLNLEAGLDPDEPSVEYLRERAARLEAWFTSAKRDLAEYEEYVAKNVKSS